MVVALMLTWSTRKPGNLGDPCAHRGAVGAHLRLLRDDRAIHMVDDCAACTRSSFAAWRRKTIGRRALPSRVGRREMLADVAKAGGAEQGVGDRVEHDVGVAVAGEPAACGTSMPPSITGPSPAKAWTSKPMPVRGTRRPASHCSARSKSAGVVSLSSAGSPSTVATCIPAARSTVVSSVGRGAGPGRVGAAQRVQPESLRGLHADEPVAVDRRRLAVPPRARAYRRSEGQAPRLRRTRAAR